MTFMANAADKHLIDSLKLVIEEARHDTLVCDAYLSWGMEAYRSNPDTALILWRKAHDIAKVNLASHPPDNNQGIILEKKYLSLLADALNNIGVYYMNQGDIQKGLEYYLKSLKNQEKIGDKKGVATSLSNIGLVYKKRGDIQKALEYNFKSLKIYEELGTSTDKVLANAGKKGMGGSFNNIGVIYKNQKDLSGALEYYNKSLKIREEMGNKQGVASTLSNIGVIYKIQGDLQNALQCHFKSLKIREDIEYKRGIANSLNNIGTIYQIRGDFQIALQYHFKSLKIKEELRRRKGVAGSLNNIGAIYLELNELGKAKEYAHKSIEIARELGFPEKIRNAAALISKVHKKQGDFQQALEMYELFIQMRDSITNEETQKATIRQQTKYEFEKAQLIKEQEAKEAQRKVDEATARRDNLQYSVLLICLLVIGVIVALLGRLSLPVKVAEGIIFFSFLIFFEFLLVLADPYIEIWSGGAPGFKLLFNAGIAALIFPAHAFFESQLKGRLVKN